MKGTKQISKDCGASINAMLSLDASSWFRPGDDNDSILQENLAAFNTCGLTLMRVMFGYARSNMYATCTTFLLLFNFVTG